MEDYPLASENKDKYKKQFYSIIKKRNLVGVANDTKWNELIHFMRNCDDWKPSYRSLSINGYLSEWDVEWFYHLPFPFIGVEWFEIGMEQEINQGKLIKRKVINHSKWIVEIVKKIGFEFEVYNDIIRIYGYFPKSMDGINNNQI